MKQVAYTQIWGMAEWMEEQHDLVSRAFQELDQVQWLYSQGYKGHIARHYEVTSDNFHIQVTFDIPDEIYTYLILKWPEEILTVDFDGPTIKETR